MNCNLTSIDLQRVFRCLNANVKLKFWLCLGILDIEVLIYNNLTIIAMATATIWLMQYSLMVKFKDFKPADTNCRMMTESKSSVFITCVWVLFKSMDGGQINIE